MNATCPIDEKPLSLNHTDRLDVMSCGACKGAWLPATSAGTLLARLASATPPQQKFFDKVKAEGHPSSLECLECGTELLTVEHRDVDIDVCPDCGGIWFDGGELQRFRTAAAPPPPPTAPEIPARAMSTKAKVGAAAAGAAVLGAAGVAAAAQPPQPAASALSGVSDVVVDDVMDVVGDVAVSVFSAIIESIFD